MNLAVDIGNTLTKMALINEGQIVDTFRVERPDEAFFDSLFASYPQIERAIVVSTCRDCAPVVEQVKRRVNKFIYFDRTVKVPLKNLYRTPETLGHDRVAGAVAAAAVYPDNNILIVDFGTAITVDLVTAQGEFAGGVISPGMMMRFSALHECTDLLPLGRVPESPELIGNDTLSALGNGVINGIIFEIEGYISRYSEKYPDLRFIFTGGDSDYFVKFFKKPIFTTRDLVVYGLNRILEYNV